MNPARLSSNAFSDDDDTDDDDDCREDESGGGDIESPSTLQKAVTLFAEIPSILSDGGFGGSLAYVSTVTSGDDGPAPFELKA